MRYLNIKKILSVFLALVLFFEPCITYADQSSGVAVTQQSAKEYSDRWFSDSTGWHLGDGKGAMVRGTWVNDLTSYGTGSQWYLIDENGRMVDSPFIRTPEGDLYALHMEHDGHYGRMLDDDFMLDGRKISVNKAHDGTFGKIILPEDIRYITGKYPVLSVTVPTSNAITLKKQISSVSSSYSSPVREIKKEAEEEDDDIENPSGEMGFEEASSNFALFVRPVSGKGSIPEIREHLRITDVSRLDTEAKDHQNITYGLIEQEDGVFLIWPDYEDGFGDHVHIYEPGHTYVAEIPGDCAYILGGTPHPDMDDEIIWADKQIKKVNFNIYAEEFFDAKLDSSVEFINAEKVNGLSEEAFGGVCQAYIEENGEISAETADQITGTFTYEESLSVGDTVAIYVGERPFTEDGDQEIRFAEAGNDLAYLTITEKSGNLYSYRTAEMEEVLFIPDILPIEKKAILSEEEPPLATSSTYGSTARKATSSVYGKKVKTATGSDYERQETEEIPTVSGNVLLGSIVPEDGVISVKKSGLPLENGQVPVGPGDFLAIYEEDGSVEDVIYGLITERPSVGEQSVTFTYDIISYDEMKEMYSMHYTVPVEMNLSEEEAAEKEQEILEALLENEGELMSGLVNAGIEEYVTSQEFADLTGEPLLGAGFSDRVKITEQPVPSVYINRDRPLQAFDNQYNGLIVTIRLTFAVCIDQKYDVRLELEYEHQYGLDYHIDGSVTCQKGFLGIPNPATMDASVTMSIDTYSFYHFRLLLRGETTQNSTFDETRLDKDEQNFIKEFDQAQGVIKELAKPFGLEYVKDYITDNLGNAGNTGLTQMCKAYAAFMGRSNTMGWFTCPPVELFQVSHRVIYKLVQIRMRGDLCFQVKLNAQLFVEYNQKSAERVTYTVALRSQVSKVKEVTQLMQPEVQTGVYVFGHAGFRVGIKMTFEFGLIHVKVAKAAIILEAGLYSELLGVFAYYYHELGNQIENVAFGFMNFEAGTYVIITALAQALNMKQLLVTKNLMDKKWPFFTLGIEEICFDFDQGGETVKPISLKAGTTVTLPAEYLRVKSLALNTGIISTKDLTQTGQCKKIRVDVEGLIYTRAEETENSVLLHVSSYDRGKTGKLILTFDHDYDIMDGVVGEIPGFSVTIPIIIYE